MIEAKTKEIEAKTKEMEAKSKEIEAKCLSKAEIKELITDDCSKNPCQNAKSPISRFPRTRPGPNRRPAPSDPFPFYDNKEGFFNARNNTRSATHRRKRPNVRRPGNKARPTKG